MHMAAPTINRAPTINCAPTKKSTTSDTGLWVVPYCNPLGGSHEGGGGLTPVELTSAFWSSSRRASSSWLSSAAKYNSSPSDGIYYLYLMAGADA